LVGTEGGRRPLCRSLSSVL